MKKTIILGLLLMLILSLSVSATTQDGLRAKMRVLLEGNNETSNLVANDTSPSRNSSFAYDAGTNSIQNKSCNKVGGDYGFWFDGTSQLKNTSGRVTGVVTENITICTWFKSIKTTGDPYITYWSDAKLLELKMIMPLDNVAGKAYLRVNGIQANNINTSYNNDEWHLYCAAANLTGDISITIDGTHRARAGGYAGGGGGVTGIFFGAQDGATFFTGCLDQITIYEGLLNETERILLWNNTNGTPLSLGELGGGPPPPAPPAPTGNITIDLPVNGTAFGITQIQGNSSMIWVNGTHNFTLAAASCYINDTRWTAGSNLTHNFTFLNNTALGDGYYHINVSCNTTGKYNGSDVTIFYIDTVLPVITPLRSLRENLTIVYNGTLVTQINFSDTVEIYSINVTFSNSTVIYSTTNAGVTFYSLNISFGMGNTQNKNITARVCDAHTSNAIEDIRRVDYTKNGLKYVIKDRILWFPDDWVHIYPKDYSLYVTPNTYKNRKGDRYAFIFNKKTAPRAGETFVIESTEFIDISKAQKFGGHLVIPNLGKNGYWIDFENDGATSYDIVRISPTKIEVTVYGLTGNDITFNSIGELNCVSQTYWVGNIAPEQGFTTQVIMGDTVTFNLNITEDTNVMDDANASFYYNNTLYPAGNSSNFSVSIDTPLLGVNSSNITFNWVLSINGSDYNITGTDQNVSNFFLDNCTVWGINAINFSVLNMSDNSAVRASMVFNFNYYRGNINKNFTMSVTESTQNFCINPPYVTIYSDIHVDYSSNGTNTFTYTANDTELTNVSKLVELYVTSDTSLVTFNVKDTADNNLIGASINILKWDVATGTFKSSSIVQTDFNGNAYAYVNLINTWYKFIVTYEGKVVLESSPPTKVTSSPVNIVVNLGDDFYNGAVNAENIYSSLTFENSTKYFTYTWQDNTQTITNACLKIERQTLNGRRQINYSCTTALTGSLILGIGENTSTDTFHATGTVAKSGTNLILRTLSVSFDYNVIQFGLEGVWVAFLLILTVIMVGIWNPSAAIVLMLVGFVVTSVMGVLNLGLPWMVALIALGIIALVRINRKG